MRVKVKLLNPYASLPKYARVGDAGFDLESADDVLLFPGQRKLVSTGIALEIPLGYVGLVHPRSGLAHKYGISIVNAPGVIDSGYRGEIKVNLINLSDGIVELQIGDRIAQMLIQAVEQVDFEKVDELNHSVRGVNGHGSTGL